MICNRLCVCARAHEGIRSPRIGIMNGFEPLCRCWEPNPSLLKELLMVDPFFYSCIPYIFIFAHSIPIVSFTMFICFQIKELGIQMEFLMLYALTSLSYSIVLFLLELLVVISECLYVDSSLTRDQSLEAFWLCCMRALLLEPTV